ncbi:MAG TPA: 2,3-bisphosphoglycerate-independent phosphoglycerate mutase [Gammaproteobacteria bacterium]|mgnify:FL=1|nr:2,3-bisphosphoglycerate-independent phosphoglycerate mutase [Gammaproteobacteria bacterium]HRA42780.1 2,3-bisphosphoglycerate-independent phosphoglycerate mutase [Gammaproteobacteria bacterium]
MTSHPIALIILDGFGYSASLKFNAIKSAKTPVWDRLLEECPHTTLDASGLAVGLPNDQMGNSEVGHLTIGAGRVLMSDLMQVSTAIENGHFNQNPVLIAAIEKAKQPGCTLHILGLLSPGGVHSHESHIHALIELAKEKGVSNIVMHAFLDGRDTPPKSATNSLDALQKICRIGSLSGRYYAMDRDKRWERTKTVYELLTENKAPFTFSSALEALEGAYSRNETDEFVQPTVITPSAPILDNDVVIFMNFRSDRARQLSITLTDPHFSGFKRPVFPKLSEFVTLTEYANTITAKIAFPPTPLNNTLGEYLQNNHYRQLRIAETEKYAHVTFFFNGGHETSFEGEDRILVPSKKVATYDLAPEMSAFELTEKLVAAIHEKKYDVIICNYANADMVGHTGNFDATVKAIEALDICLGQVIEALKAEGVDAIITADHGNAEMMFDEVTHQPHTAHTLARVPFLYVGRPARINHEHGVLSDIAPTIISLLGQSKPIEMTGSVIMTLDLLATKQ